MLRVISQSSFNLQLVLDTLVVTAARLCLADQAVVFRRNADDTYALAANFGFPLAYEEYHRARGPIPVALRSGSPAVLARVASEREGDPYRGRRHRTRLSGNPDHAGEAAHDPRCSINARRRADRGFGARAPASSSRSPNGRSNWYAPSPIRRSSQSRTHGC